jgi:replicative DNA helicase
LYSLAGDPGSFPANVKALGDMVKVSKLRNLAGAITSRVGRESPDATIIAIEEYLTDMSRVESPYTAVTIGNAIKQAVDLLEERMKTPGLPGLTTGYSGLNRMFGGFEKRKLYYVGSRPSEGKTALMLNFALGVMGKTDRVGIISVESSVKELGDRLLAIKGSIDALQLRRGEMKLPELMKLQTTVESLYHKPGLIYHNPHASIGDVELQVRRMVSQIGVEIVFVDYVQLISGGVFRARHEEVAHISRRLKALASDCEIPIVALAQMRRDVDGRKAGMGDFGESSALEKDADVMMAIHHNDNDDSSEILVLKARDGITGVCEVNFIRQYLQFREIIGK